MTKIRTKQEKFNYLKDIIKKRFNTLMDGICIELGVLIPNIDISRFVANLKFDYDNFSNVDEPIRFIYPAKKFEKINKKKFSENNYKLLLGNVEFSEQEKIYFIVADKLLTEYKNLKFKTNEIKNENVDFTGLTFRQAFCYNYFFYNNQRCCFCGQLLENTSYDDNQEYVHADIEHIFPKSNFPQFAMHPDNFAPACKECNQGEKGINFFDNKKDFFEALNDLGINEVEPPLQLWKNVLFNFDSLIQLNMLIDKASLGYKLLEFYGIPKRAKIILARCYNILFNQIKNTNIASPESLERFLEMLASSNWSELNDGYSLNNSPKIWQEFLEDILYNENKLSALWDEVKNCSSLNNNFTCY